VNKQTSPVTAHVSKHPADVRSTDRAQHTRTPGLPSIGGISLKPQHYEEILQQRPEAGWFEIHAENYLGAGGPPLHYLQKIREHYPLSIHGVGMSIGSANGLDKNHLRRVASLVERFEPESFSEHLAWSTHDTEFFSDLLPVPYNQEVEDVVCNHIDLVQSTLQRPMLLENPSNYLTLETSTMQETEFLNNVVRRTGCGLLLDVNNIYISAVNCNYSAEDYVRALKLDHVGEIHLAGHSADHSDPDEILLIDTHDCEVADPVWSLFQFTVKNSGIKPSLIEWDSAVPTLTTMLVEKQKADQFAQQATEQAKKQARGTANVSH